MERYCGLAAAWLLAGLAHRWWSEAPAGSLRHAVSDGLSHLAFGLATGLPAARRVPAPKRLLSGVLAGALAIDLDHVVAARSIRLRDCATMPQRPTTHSLPVAVALTMLALRQDRCFGIGLGLGLASHLVRDLVTGGAPLIHPRRVVRLSGVWAVPLALGLSLGGSWLVRRLPNEASSRDVVLG